MQDEDERWSDSAGARWEGGTHVVVGALLLEGLLGEDVAGAEEDEGRGALGDHRPLDQRSTGTDRLARRALENEASTHLNA